MEPRKKAAPAILFLLSSLWHSATCQSVTVSSYAELVDAVKLANTNGLACKQKEGCLGKVVSAQMTKDVLLQGPLPGLTNNAHLSVTGACIFRKPSRCVVDGQMAHVVFPGGVGSPFGPPSKLDLSDLIFQKAKGGVLTGIWSTVQANRVIFRNNINGVVNGLGFFGGIPTQTYINCRFVTNNGTAINVGGNKLGLAKDGVGIVVRRGVFRGNTGHVAATGRINGGAVSVAGLGKVVFENTLFSGNSAVGMGGAVHGDQTQIVFRAVTFSSNKAAKGGGAVSGEVGLYQNTTVSFCSSSFTGNSNSATGATDNLLFTNPGINVVTVHFCGTPVPAASVFPKPPLGIVTSGEGSSCSSAYCE